MGHDVSKPIDLKGPALAIKGCLESHLDHINNLKQTVKTQHAHVQMLCLSLDELAETNDTPESAENMNLKQFAIRQDFSSKWRRHTKDLLGIVQNSLMSQCELLVRSFQQLDQHVTDIIRTIGIELSSSDQKVITPQDNDTISTSYDTSREKLQEENDKLADEKQKFSIKLTEMTKKVTEYETESTSLKDTIKELETKKEQLEQIVKKCEENRTVFIQVFFQVKGGDMMLKIIDELKRLLAKQLQVERRNLKFVICQNKEDVDQEIPLFVLCINASRLGTDVGSILQDLNVTSKVSVVVFHHKDIHALPNQSSERVLTDPEFKDLGGIFDIAFLSDKGIYECEMNQSASLSIGEFLKTHL